MESLIPVIVGGLIGLAGGIAGPPLSHWLNEGSANRKKRAEKLEEMICHIHAFEHWLDVQKNIRVFGEIDNREPTPLPRAQSIATIYYPQFVDDLAMLDVAARNYVIWMLGRAQKRLEGDIASLRDGLGEAYRPYLAQKTQLLNKLQAFAAAEFAIKPPFWSRNNKVDQKVG
jgi:hypothetical protein